MQYFGFGVRNGLNGEAVIRLYGGALSTELTVGRQHAPGPETFRASIEAQLGRGAVPAVWGRRRKGRKAGEVHSDPGFTQEQIT